MVSGQIHIRWQSLEIMILSGWTLSETLYVRIARTCAKARETEEEASLYSRSDS